MVYLVTLANGFNEKGSGKAFETHSFFGSMVQECCTHVGSTVVNVAYCDDGNPDPSWQYCEQHPDAHTDLKVLKRLVRAHMGDDVSIRMLKFSFLMPNASAILAMSHVFYFRGFGIKHCGNVYEIFDPTRPVHPVVEEFQNRVLFHDPRPLLTIMVCGAAMLCGKEFLSDRPEYQGRIRCMELLGPASIRYFACQRVTPRQVGALTLHEIPLGPTVGNLFKFQRNGRFSLRCVNIAPSSKKENEPFRSASFEHTDRVVTNFIHLWKLHKYQYPQKPKFFWAHRPDGTIIGSYEHRNQRQIVDHISVLFPGQFVYPFWY